MPHPNRLLVRKESKEYNTFCNHTAAGTPFIQHLAGLFHTNASSRGSLHRQRYFCLSDCLACIRGPRRLAARGEKNWPKARRSTSHSGCKGSLPTLSPDRHFCKPELGLRRLMPTMPGFPLRAAGMHWPITTQPGG